MNLFKKLFASVLGLIGVVFIAANLLLGIPKSPESGRPWRVEINRLALAIREIEQLTV